MDVDSGFAEVGDEQEDQDDVPITTMILVGENDLEGMSQHLAFQTIATHRFPLRCEIQVCTHILSPRVLSEPITDQGTLLKLERPLALVGD